MMAVLRCEYGSQAMTREIIRDPPPSTWAQALFLGSIAFAIVAVLLLTTTL